MNFRSDNEVGAHARIVEAVGRAFASGSAPSYGADEWTHRVEHRLRDLFEKPDLVAFPVATGTAANVLSLACCTPSWGAIYCHPQAHIAVDEANAPEFFTSGAKLCLIDGPAGKIDPKRLAKALAEPVYGVVHHPQPAAVSITQATECADPARGANAARSAARSGQADCRHRLPEFFDAAADLARDPGMASQFRKPRSLTRYVARVANRSTWQFLPAFASSLREQAVSCEVVKSVARSGDRFTDSSECGRDRLPV